MAFSKEDIKESPWLADREWVKVYNVRYPEQDVYVGVNGYTFSIKPMEPVYIPKAVIGVLNNAVETHYSKEVIGPNQQRKEVPFHRFQVVPCAPPADWVPEEKQVKPKAEKSVVDKERVKNEVKKDAQDFISSVVEAE